MNERLEKNPRLAGVLLLLCSGLLLVATGYQFRRDGSLMGAALALAGLAGGLGCTLAAVGRRWWGLHFMAMVAGCAGGIWLMDRVENGNSLGLLAPLFGR